MSEIDRVGGWRKPTEDPSEAHPSQIPSERQQEIDLKGHESTVSKISAIAGTELWNLSGLEEIRGTSNLDEQEPETLYFLERVAKIPLVVEIYVEHRPNGKRKHWTVLSERDFDVMDKIYNIEQEVLDRFPGANIQFRVTVQTEDGPSIASKAYKIYEEN